MKYKFFREQEMDYGEDSVLAIMKHLKAERIPEDSLLFEEGDEGERFYIILKGVVGVEIAKEVPVPGHCPKLSIQARVQGYL